MKEQSTEILQLHYFLEGGIHQMDAFSKNKAEAELLKILKYSSEILDLKLDFEVQALEEGGIKEFLRIINKKKTKKYLIPLLAYIGGIFTTILTNTISEHITKDHEFEELKKIETQLHIQKLQKELQDSESNYESINVEEIANRVIAILLKDGKIIMHKSNFYKNLLDEHKITQISTLELDEEYKPKSEEKFVKRQFFKNFIVDKINLEPEIHEGVVIEIISPVFSKSKMKWKGLFNYESISFNLRDSEFRNSVLNKEISFSSGTAIRCTLEYIKELDPSGEEKISKVNVHNVIEIIDGDKTRDTKKGRRIKQSGDQSELEF